MHVQAACSAAGATFIGFIPPLEREQLLRDEVEAMREVNRQQAEDILILKRDRTQETLVSLHQIFCVA